MKKACLILLMSFLLVSVSFAADKDVKVIMETVKGDIELTLNREKAPKTVDNFLAYVKEGFYDGTIFHRVIKGFMIQGGGFTESFDRKKTKAPIMNEADNGLKNDKGTIAMARTSNPHSATSQFFINTVDNAFLNHKSKSGSGWGYCVFGKVTKGMEAVSAIENTKTTIKAMMKDGPVETMVIKKVRIVEPKLSD